MKVSKEFSKYAQSYKTYNIIQNKVVKKLLSTVHSKPKKILDLGCGSGAVVKNIDWDFEHFVGVDFAPMMLELHPKSNSIVCINGNFDDPKLFHILSRYEFDYIISSSALQWADKLDEVFFYIKSMNIPFSFAIFTSGTFQTLNKTANLPPLLRSADELRKLSQQYFDCEPELIQYSLEFDNVRDMFQYIKKSGVSGSRRVLSYKETKRLMQEYPSNTLEFEVAFIGSDLRR